MKKFCSYLPILSIIATTGLSPSVVQAQSAVTAPVISPPRFSAIPVEKDVQFNSLLPDTASVSSQYQFTKIGIRHYDAGVIADLITQPNGIIVVPPNFVVPANAAPATAPTTQAATAPTTQAATAPTTQAATAPNILPAGVRRIFVLESDNSLVIEATPDGLASLSR